MRTEIKVQGSSGTLHMGGGWSDQEILKIFKKDLGKDIKAITVHDEAGKCIRTIYSSTKGAII